MKTEDMPVVELQGDARSRGRAHGETLRGAIREVLDAHDAILGMETGWAPAEFRRRMLAGTGHLARAAESAPVLLDEVRAIAEGANQDFERLFHLQLMDEEWVFLRNRALEPGGDLGHCSAFAAREADCTVVAQNMDIGEWADGFQFVAHQSDHAAGFEIQTLSFPGYLGLCGMSARGLAVCCNTLMELDFSTSGLPVAFVFRSLLQSPSMAEAVRRCREIAHASGQNYLIGARDGIASLECSAHRVAEAPLEEARIFHTNHALANRDDGYVRRRMPERDLGTRCGSRSSPARLESLRRHLGDNRIPVDAARAMQALRAKDDPAAPVCRDGTSSDAPDRQIGFTFGSMVGVVPHDPAAPAEFHVAAGPPCRARYRRLEFAAGADG